MNREKYLTPPEIAKILGVSADQVLCYIDRGELEAVNTSLSTRRRLKSVAR